MKKDGFRLAVLEGRVSRRTVSQCLEARVAAHGGRGVGGLLVKKKAHRLRRWTAGGHAERHLSLAKLASRHLEAAASEVCS